MKWLSFGPQGGERPGVLLDENTVLDVAAAWPQWPRSWRGLLAAGMASEIERLIGAGEFSQRHVHPLEGLILAPPVPDPSKVVALGRNYESHAAEQKRAASTEPLLFAKAPSSLIGHGQTVRVPPHESQPDFEAELALVIGLRSKDVRHEDALDHVAGITAFNDVSGREAQFKDRLWLRGKGFDTFGPVGPWVVTLDEIRDPDDLGLKMVVNGEVRQDARTSEMIVGCAGIVAYISQQMTLLPGDLIATGTPGGVGVFRKPPIFLEGGDQMEVHLEGVGVLANPVSRSAG
jgi:2-keto-4-pentenoate hydratase/2-oxohepta-3-ene-1,7-dioic acid hydratase in catechol pathway